MDYLSLTGLPFVAHAFCDRVPQDAPLEREHSRGKKVAWIGVVGKGGDFAKPLAVLYLVSNRTRYFVSNRIR
jgi:hypothetical protein